MLLACPFRGEGEMAVAPLTSAAGRLIQLPQPSISRFADHRGWHGGPETLMQRWVASELSSLAWVRVNIGPEALSLIHI